MILTLPAGQASRTTCQNFPPDTESATPRAEKVEVAPSPASLASGSCTTMAALHYPIGALHQGPVSQKSHYTKGQGVTSGSYVSTNVLHCDACDVPMSLLCHALPHSHITSALIDKG